LENVEYLGELEEEPIKIALDRRVTDDIIVWSPNGNAIALWWQKEMMIGEVSGVWFFFSIKIPFELIGAFSE
jgi:hypothetical protein